MNSIFHRLSVHWGKYSAGGLLGVLVWGLLSLPTAFAQGTQTEIATNPLNVESPADLLSLIVNILLGLIGFVAVIYLIWAGFKYVTAGGDSKKAGEAKEGITHAIIGLIVAFVAFLLVQLVYSLLNVDNTFDPGSVPGELGEQQTGGGGTGSD